MKPIDTATQLCAVIGDPVGHSLSPCMHNAAFEAAGLNFVYTAFQVKDVEGCLKGMRALRGFRGMSVTIPHKRAVMAHLDEIEPMARHVGSVNTITNEGGRLIGATTDGPGTLRVFEEAGIDLTDKRVLFLGAGGAVRAVAFAVAEMTKAAHITLLGRAPRKVDDLTKDLRAKTQASVSAGHMTEDLESAMASHDVIIQGTPVGMFPLTSETCVPKEMFRPSHVVFDMVYRPYKTRLLREAEEVGCAIIPGIEMLIHQAVLQFERWTGAEAPVEVMRQAVRAKLKA